MNSSAGSCEISIKLNLSQGRHPRMFLSGVQSEHPPGFPLKACGNDGLGKVQLLWGRIQPLKIQRGAMVNVPSRFS
jgi:hypothetical protein